MRPNGVEKQVYPAWWQPWVNTLLYLPLATNSNDQSWNGNNGTDTNITYSDWKAVFNTSGTSCILIDTTSLPTHDYTLHMIVARTTNSWYQVAFRYSDGSGYDNARCYISGYGTYTDGWVTHQQTDLSVCNSSVRVNKWLVDTDTSEHLLSFVVYESWYTYIKFYIDWVYQVSKVATSSYYANAKISFWNRWYSMNEWLKGTMREVIMENRVWSDSEVLDLAKQFWFA